MAELPTETTIDPRLRAYLDAELRHAEADFPRLTAPAVPRRRRRVPFATLLGAAAVLLATVVVGTQLLGRTNSGPAAVHLGPDGLPSSIGGEPVLRGGAIGAQATGGGSFLAGGTLTLASDPCPMQAAPSAAPCVESWALADAAGSDPRFGLVGIVAAPGFVHTSGALTVVRVDAVGASGATASPCADCLGTLAVEAVVWRQPTKGPMPPDASPPQGGEVFDALVPDFVATVGRDGTAIVGYTPKAYLIGPFPETPGSPSNPPQEPPAPVYADDLTTLVGHMVAGVGFVPLGATAPPAASAMVAPSAAPALDLSTRPWYTMSAIGGCPANAPAEPLSACSGGGPSRPGYLELFAGTLDGRTRVHVNRSLPVSAGLWVGRGSLPSGSGPYGTKILYWLYDGTQSELHVADAVSGRDDTVLTTRAVIYGAVLDPASGAVYYNPLDASSRHDLGVWRLDAGATAPTFLVPPASHAYTGSQQWDRQLLLTPDGTRLVVRDCENLSCAVAVYRTDDGALVATATGLDTVYGATDTELIVGLGCGSGCAVGAVDLASGRVRTVTSDACAASGGGVLGASSDGSPVLLVSASTAAGCGDDGAVLSVDLTTGSVGTVWAGAAPKASGDGLVLAPVMDGYQGYVTPAGWGLLAPGGNLAWTNHTGSLVPLLVSLSGGTELPLAVQPVFSH
jgi:hypothetical protein